jgi:cysteinyl-tRNA synthetase
MRALIRRAGVRQLSSDAPDVAVFNSLRDELTPLRLREPGKVTWYTCGPTVYDVAHLGHARTYVSLDILRRIFTDFLHLDVDFAMGMTDVDDKIITRARERGENPRDLARHFEESFTRDMDDLGVRRPSSVGRVTEHIPQILAYIERIMANGLAYRAPDGVYFNTAALGEAYGRLAPSEAKGTGPVRAAGGDPPASAAAAGKLDARDFALWKLDGSGESSDQAAALAWDSPWGSGRPGWHIECSAISAELCGEHLDLHSGGIDLKFPHHNNECAQCEAHSLDFGADKWSTAFVHTGHLYIAARKMSKSLKNFISVRDFLDENEGLSGADDFRMFCLQNKYRASVHFSPSRIAEARGLRRRFVDFLESARYLSASPPPAAEEGGASSVASSSQSPVSVFYVPLHFTRILLTV